MRDYAADFKKELLWHENINCIRVLSETVKRTTSDVMVARQSAVELGFSWEWDFDLTCRWSIFVNNSI